MPFLCPHVTCQLSRVRLSQALSSLNLSGFSSLTPIHNRPNNCQALSGSVQPHSRPPAFLSQTPFMPLSLKKHVTLLRYQPFTIQSLNATPSQDGTLRLLSLLSLIAPRLLILTPRHSLAFLYSFCLRTSRTHVVLFSHVVALSF